MNYTCALEKLMAKEVTRDCMEFGNNKCVKGRNPIKLNVQLGLSYYRQVITLSTLYRPARRLYYKM